MTTPAEHALSPRTGYGDAVRISWGLVQIPVRLHIVADKERSVPARHMFKEVVTKVDGKDVVEDHPIGNKRYDKVTNKDVDPSEIVMKAETGAGVYVELTDDEIETLSTFTPNVADIVTFIPAGSLADTYTIERCGVWRPDTMKVGKTRIVDPTAAKAAALLSEAMTERGVAALALVPSKSGGQYVALLPDGRCSWLAFAENVRRIPAAEPVHVAADERVLASQLIDGIGISTPVLLDEAGARIRAHLDAKAVDVNSVPRPLATVTPLHADITAMLSQSIADAKAAKAAAKPKRTPKAKAS